MTSSEIHNKMSELIHKTPVTLANIVSTLGFTLTFTDANEILKFISLFIVVIINCFVLYNKADEWAKKRKIKQDNNEEDQV